MPYMPRNLHVSIAAGSTWIELPRSSLSTSSSALLKRLPPGLRLAPFRLFADEYGEAAARRRRLLVNAYRISTWCMQGWRLEVVTLCHTPRRKRSHFDILAVYTDTLHWDPSRGIQMPNANFVERRRSGGRRGLTVVGSNFFLDFEGRVSSAQRRIDADFVEANRVCFFGDDSTPLHVDFDASSICKDVTLFSDASVRTSLLAGGAQERVQLLPDGGCTTFFHPYSMSYMFGDYE